MLEDTKLLNVKQTIFGNSILVIYKIIHDLFLKHLIDEINLVVNVHTYYTNSRSNFYVSLMITATCQNCSFH